MRSFDVIKKPILTEKTYLEMNSASKYTFEVDLKSNKREIAVAFQQLFNIKPLKVNIVVSKPQRFRTGTKFPSYTPLFKKAIITLPAGTQLNILGDEELAEEAVNQEEATKIEKDKKE
jgi:large subunit ribosomal protein L23